MSYFTERMSQGRGTVEEQISRLKSELEAAEVVVIGAGAGLSTSAGFTYSDERFEKYFFDFAREYKISEIFILTAMWNRRCLCIRTYFLL